MKQGIKEKTVAALKTSAAMIRMLNFFRHGVMLFLWGYFDGYVRYLSVRWTSEAWTVVP